jgi:hypothetical protein
MAILDFRAAGHKPMNNPLKLRWFILLPGLAMSVGWGIRGQIGHWTGAMIPGTFLALALSILLQDKQIFRGLVIALTAVSFGFGAQMTTVQTARMILSPEAFHYPVPPTPAWGYLGVVIKGALWALFGGAFLGLGLAASCYRRKDVILSLIIMVASFAFGWAVINRPKFVYFSADRPEIWGGLLFGAIALLAMLTVRGRTRIPLVLALCAAAGGGIGYPLGVTLATVGVHSTYVGRWYPWWKVVEMTFGALMGVGLGLGTYLVKNHLPDAVEYKDPAAEAGFSAWGVILGLAIGFLWTALYNGIPWIILGPILICLAFYFSKAAWHVGITLTYCGAAANVVVYYHQKLGLGNAVPLWALVGLATLVISWKVTTWWGKTDRITTRNAFVFVLWAIFLLSYLIVFVTYVGVVAAPQGVTAVGGRSLHVMEINWSRNLVIDVIFTVAAFVLTWMAYRTSRPQESPEK